MKSLRKRQPDHFCFMLQSTAVAYFLLRLFSFSGLLLLCCPSLFLTHSFTKLCRVLLRKFVLNWTTNLRLRNCKHLACRRLQLLGLSEQAPFLYLSLFFVASFVEGFFVFVYAFEWTLTEFTEIILLLLLLGVQLWEVRTRRALSYPCWSSASWKPVPSSSQFTRRALKM